MPVHQNPPNSELVIVGGTYSNAAITTTPTDISLNACAIVTSSGYLTGISIVAAFIELTGSADAAVLTALSAAQELDISPDGTNWYNAVTLTNLLTFPLNAVSNRHFFSLRGSVDVSAYVKAAILAGHNIQFKIPNATATFNTLYIVDVQCKLHLFVLS